MGICLIGGSILGQQKYTDFPWGDEVMCNGCGDKRGKTDTG